MEGSVGLPVRVATVEDDARYRSSLDVLLRHARDFEPVAAFGSAESALGALAGLPQGPPAPWDLVLMDLDLPEMGGIECTRRLKARFCELNVVVLTVFEERSRILEAICARADGYLLKRTPAGELMLQLRSVVAGGSPLSAGVARTVLDLVRRHDGEGGPGSPASSDPSVIGLTPRESEVLACLLQGMSYKGVAASLGISIDTVRSHIRQVYRKLQVHSVAEAVGRALREGLRGPRTGLCTFPQGERDSCRKSGMSSGRAGRPQAEQRGSFRASGLRAIRTAQPAGRGRPGPWVGVPGPRRARGR